jgi:hypothetical protein
VTEAAWSPSDDHFDRRRRRRADLDRFLQLLVRMANHAGDDAIMNITLFVGGAVVSGYLTSIEKYFEGIAEEMASTTEDEEIASALRRFADLGKRFEPDDEPGPEDATDEQIEERDLAGPHYIHLRDAHMFVPGQSPMPANRGVWWRGRLEAVDGFMLGGLSAG